MKKLGILIVGVLLVGSLSACGQEDVERFFSKASGFRFEGQSIKEAANGIVDSVKGGIEDIGNMFSGDTDKAIKPTEKPKKNIDEVGKKAKKKHNKKKASAKKKQKKHSKKRK